MWTVEDNGEDINWNDGVRYAKDLQLDGFSDWRLPNIEELEKLHDPKGAKKFRNIREPFRLSDWWVWSSTKVDPDCAWGFLFGTGKREADRIDDFEGGRVLCVRP